MSMKKKAPLVAALTVLVAVGVASGASSPFKHLSDPVGNPGVPECVTAASNTEAPFVCKLRPFASPNWQAESGEWVIVRTAWAQDSCPSLAAVVATYSLDGKALDVQRSSCQFSAGLGVWQVDFRSVIPPLPKGDHSITTVYYFPEAVIGGPAGTTHTFNTILTVS
jgi:hypothetical protein